MHLWQKWSSAGTQKKTTNPLHETCTGIRNAHVFRFVADHRVRRVTWPTYRKHDLNFNLMDQNLSFHFTDGGFIVL